MQETIRTVIPSEGKATVFDGALMKWTNNIRSHANITIGSIGCENKVTALAPGGYIKYDAKSKGVFEVRVDKIEEGYYVDRYDNGEWKVHLLITKLK